MAYNNDPGNNNNYMFAPVPEQNMPQSAYGSQAQAMWGAHWGQAQPDVGLAEVNTVSNGSVEVRDGDWTCGKCNANVFQYKSECFRCNTTKEETFRLFSKREAEASKPSWPERYDPPPPARPPSPDEAPPGSEISKEPVLFQQKQEPRQYHKVLFDFESTDLGRELSVAKDDVVFTTNTRTESVEGWLLVQTVEGNSGYVPAAYLETQGGAEEPRKRPRVEEQTPNYYNEAPTQQQQRPTQNESMTLLPSQTPPPNESTLQTVLRRLLECATRSAELKEAYLELTYAMIHTSGEKMYLERLSSVLRENQKLCDADPSILQLLPKAIAAIVEPAPYTFAPAPAASTSAGDSAALASLAATARLGLPDSKGVCEQCGAVVLNKTLSIHLATKCLGPLVKCVICQSPVLKKLMEKHTNSKTCKKAAAWAMRQGGPRIQQQPPQMQPRAPQQYMPVQSMQQPQYSMPGHFSSPPMQTQEQLDRAKAAQEQLERAMQTQEQAQEQQEQPTPMDQEQPMEQEQPPQGEQQQEEQEQEEQAQAQEQPQQEEQEQPQEPMQQEQKEEEQPPQEQPEQEQKGEEQPQQEQQEQQEQKEEEPQEEQPDETSS